MSDDIVVNIAFKGNATDFLAELSRQAGNAKRQLEEIGQSSAALSRVERQLAQASQAARGMTDQTNKAAQATQGWAQKWVPFKGAFQEAEANSKGLWRSIDSGIASAEKSLARGTKAAQDFQDAQTGKRMGAIGASAMNDWDKQFAALSKAADENTQKMQAARRAVEEYQNSLSNARYVLYDVAGTLSVLGIALVAPLGAVVGVAVDFQKEFAQVARTSGAVGSELQALKADFDDLYGAIPVTYDSLAKIATLAGQLGVPAERIAAFTEVVAKTSAVTDLTVEAAATAFGRLDALIPNVRGQYDRLGSSIAKVGVNSVATESQIVNISTQISSMGSFAGLTAQDIIGLSGALASIGAQPELSRGTITRVFTIMSRAVADGGARLDEFARISGVSSSEFASTWGTPEFGQTFVKFMQGIKAEGGNAVSALNELGITSVRDVPLLLRLANAADSTGKAGALLAQTINDANIGWKENTELQRQFDIIAGTVAAKVEVLANNFNLLLQAIGGPLLGGIGDFVDLLTYLTERATDFAQSDLGGAVTRIIVVLSALLGVLALAGGAMALFGASSIGVYQALLFVAAQSPKTAAAILGTAGAAAVADGSLKAGAASALAFSRALKAISVIGAIALLPDVLGALNKELLKLRGVDISKASGALKEIASSGDGLASYFRNVGSISSNFASDIVNNFTGVGVVVKSANEALKQMATEGNFQGIAKDLNAFNKAAKDVDANRVLEMFPDVTAAAEAAGVELKVVGDEIKVVGDKSQSASPATDEMSSSLQQIEANAEAAQGALDDMKAALDAIAGTQISAAAAADTLQRSINDTWEKLNEGGIVLDGADNASIGFRESLRDIEQKARDAGTAIAENGGTVDEAIGAWNLGRESVIGMLTAMGLSREEAVTWADTNLGASQTVQDAMAAVARSVNLIPEKKTVTLVADTAVAQQKINDFIWANDGRRINLYVDSFSGRQVAGINIDRAYASGGPINGPGTDTSDSILARLSNNEYVIRAKAARALGTGRLDYMNRYGKLPAFANGGPVGGASMPSITNNVESPGVRVYIAGEEITNRVRVEVDKKLGAVARSAGMGGGR